MLLGTFGANHTRSSVPTRTSNTWSRGGIMKKLAAVALSATTASVVILSGGAAQGSGSSGGWPSAYPLPTNPGRVLSQTSSTAVVRSTDTVLVVKRKLDQLYVGQKGCTVRV